MKILEVKKVQVSAGLTADQIPAVMNENGLAFVAIDTVNWDAYPYKPEVRFRIAHTGKEILIHYQVKEASVRAVAQGDDGRVWEDSCTEFFVSPDSNDFYYNFECNCIGRLLLHGGVSGNRPSASEDVMHSISRWSSLGNQPFEERVGECSWESTLIIPASAFFRHQIETLDGLEMRANFYKCGDLLQTPHFLSWNAINLPEPKFHCPEFFGILNFE